MTTCTLTVEAGPLGDVDLTISYKHHAGRKCRGFEPSEPETVTIYWIKLGSQEVTVSDDYITNEIIPFCLADWNCGMESAAESKADQMREDYRRAA